MSVNTYRIAAAITKLDEVVDAQRASGWNPANASLIASLGLIAVELRKAVQELEIRDSSVYYAVEMLKTRKTDPGPTPSQELADQVLCVANAFENHLKGGKV